MIKNGLTYKWELLNICERIKVISRKGNWTEVDEFRMQHDVFSAFYIIRKLLEAKIFLTSFITNAPIDVQIIKPKSKFITLGNKNNIEKLYDLDNFVETAISVEKLCNQIIHSYIFDFHCSTDENIVEGIYFVSDFDKKKKLYFLSFYTFELLIKGIAIDKPGQILYSYDHSKGETDVYHNHNEPYRIDGSDPPQWFINKMIELGKDEKSAISFDEIMSWESKQKDPYETNRLFKNLHPEKIFKIYSIDDKQVNEETYYKKYPKVDT